MLTLILFLYSGLARADDAVIHRIFGQSMEPKNSGFCFRPATGGIPDFISQILVGPQPGQVRSALSKVTFQPSGDQINRSSRYFQETELKKLKFRGQEKPTQFVGGDPKNYRLPKEEALQRFLTSWFHEITKASNGWNQTQLSRADLFHGHLVYHVGLKDLFVVFHAKEYPGDSPSLCPTCSLGKLFQYFGEGLPGTIKEVSTSIGYQRRNYIGSFRKNLICGVNTTLFQSLVQDDGDGCTLDESKVSDLGEAGEIANLNFLPREGVSLFFDFQRGLD